MGKAELRKPRKGDRKPSVVKVDNEKKPDIKVSVEVA